MLNETEFEKLFLTRQIDRNFNWKTVEYVQTCVKDEKGIGKPFSVTFYAPINESSDKTA